MHKKRYFEFFVTLLMVAGVLIVLAMGYYSYQSISSIVEDIHKSNKPDERLSLINHLATELDNTESSIRIYAYSKQSRDLLPYARLLDSLDTMVGKLRAVTATDTSFQLRIDTIESLIHLKLNVWEEMILLYGKDETGRYLDTVSQKLEEKVESDSLRKNRSLIKKIFQRQKKVDLDEANIIQEIEQYREEDKQYAATIKQKELALARNNARLTIKVLALIEKMKEDELIARQQKAKDANKLASETYKRIGLFSLIATLASLLVVFMIARYIRKARQTQQVLEDARQKAEDLAKTKEMFAANVSHEIRTPLNVISGFVNQLSKSKLDTQQKEKVEIIKSSSDHLVHVINDVLDFSKLQTGNIQLEEVAFIPKKLCEELILYFTDKAEEKHTAMILTMDDQVPAVLKGDPLRLRQVLINLLGNAVKFTKGGNVQLQVKLMEKNLQEVKIRFTIEDSGIGMGAETLEKVFDDFVQAEGSTSRKYGGTGLGLSIVKKLVTLMNGTIHAESEAGKGSQFICDFPFKIGNRNEISEEVKIEFEIPESLKNKKILIVDDEAYNRKLISTSLKNWGLMAAEATDGNDAINKMTGEKFDLVFLDLHMPGMSGLDVAKKIRNELNVGIDETEIVIASAAHLSTEEVAQFKKLDIVKTLAKPFTEEELHALLTGKTPGIDHSVEVAQQDQKRSINIEALQKLASGDEAFVRDMLEGFITSMENGLEQMKKAIKNSMFEEISEAAHKLVPPARHLDATELVTLLKQLESKAKTTADVGLFSEMITEIEQVFSEIRSEINLYLKK